MTRDEIIGLAADDLEDVQNVHFTQEDLVDSCQDGYDFISLITECVERLGTVPIVGNQVYYDLTSLEGFFKVFAIFNSNTKQWLTPRSLVDIKSDSVRWETITGSISAFSPIGWKHVILHRRPVVTQTALDVYYTRQAPILSGGDSPEFDSDFHDVLVKYIVQDLLDQNLEYNKSKIALQDFKTRFSLLEDKLSRRSLPDRIFTLQCHYLTNLI